MSRNSKTMHHIPPERVLRHLIQHYLSATSRKPEIIQHIGKRTQRRKLICRIIFIFILFICMIYQTFDRISFYLDEPTIVEHHEEEIDGKDFPSFVIYPTSTTETLEDINMLMKKKFNSTIKEKCFHPMMYMGYEIFSSFTYNRIPSYLKDFYILLDKKRKEKINQTDNEGVTISGTSFFPANNSKIRGSTFKMVFKFNKNICNQQLKIYIQNREKKTIFGTTELSVSQKEFTNKLIFVTIPQYYEYINTKKNPCENNIGKVEKCLIQCQRQLNNYTCRLPAPFMDDLPPCKSILSELRKPRLNYEKLDKHCSYCGRTCHITTYINYVNAVESNETVLEFYTHEKTARFIREKLAYSLISLMCDIGGIVGLYFGISCLTLIDIFAYYYEIFLAKRALPQRFNYTQQKISMKVTKLSLKNESCLPSKSNLFQIVLMMLLAMLSCYYIYIATTTFFSYPISFKIYTINDLVLNFPQTLICRENEKIINLKLRLAEVRNVSCKDIHFLDLLDPPSKVSNVTDLWNHSYDKTIHLGTKLTVYGNCTYYPAVSLEYNSIESLKTKSFDLYKKVSDKCGEENTKLIIAPKDCPFYMQKVFRVRNNEINSKFLLSTKTIIRVNTPVKPCVNNLTAHKICEENCFNKKLLQQNVTCRLPFMEFDHLPLCVNAASAKQVQRYYLQALTTNTLKECSCNLICSESIYTLYSVNSFFRENRLLYYIVFNYLNNIREVIEEQLMYTVIKLLCDIGSIVSILLGTSLFSLLQIQFTH